MLKHQAWLTTHVRNLEDLIVLIYPSERSSKLGLSISSGIVEKEKLLTSGARQSLSWFRRSDPRGIIYLPWSAKWSSVWERHVKGSPPQSDALNGKAKSGDVVSNGMWQLGGKEWCYGVSGDGSNDCATEATSHVVASWVTAGSSMVIVD